MEVSLINKHVAEIIEKIKSSGNEKNRAGMARFGISVEKAFGVSMPVLREMAKNKEYKKNHELALALWKTGIHEARILAALIDDPKKVDQKQMELWVVDLNSWDLCDQLIMNLFSKTIYAENKAVEWAHREEEFVRRAGFVIMACLGMRDKKAKPEKFNAFWDLYIQYAPDERNFVKKAVNWALRQTGKSNMELREKVLEICDVLVNQPSKSAKWIARDAIRELNDPKIMERIKK